MKGDLSMGTGTPIVKEIKEQILARIKNGTPATQAATEHGVSPKTVYGWLSGVTKSQPGFMQIGKLKRENEALYALVGRLTVKLSDWEKKNDR